MSRIILPLIAVLSLGAAPCAEPTPTTCALEGGGAFTSVDELECGLSPDGVAYCHWSLNLDADGTFNWMHSDYGETGTWTCEGTEIEGVSTSGAIYEGSWDASAGILTWDGIAYVRR